MNIVFDTSVLYDHWFLDSPHFTLLHRFATLSKATLLVPEVVVLEMVKKYQDEVKDLANKHTKQAEELRLIRSRLLRMKAIDLPAYKDLAINVQTVNYEETFRKKLDELKIATPKYNAISQEAILSRCVGARKPFREGKGYRDTLIWETILHNVANASDVTFFITSNYKDFAVSKEDMSLHPDLKDDLRSLALPDECVQLSHDIKCFNDKHVLPTMTFLKDAKEKLQQGHFKEFSIQSWFCDHRESIMLVLDDHIQSLLEHDRDLANIESPSISGIEDPDTIEIDNVVELDLSRLYVEAFFTASISIQGFVFKADYYGLSENNDIFVIDKDWNDHYFLVSTSIFVPINLYFNFNILQEIVEEYDADFLETYGWCAKCGHPFLSDASEECSNCGFSGCI